jgi:hypothetical protein
VNSSNGEPVFAVMFDARDLAKHPSMSEWLKGPLKAAIEVAPYEVQVWVTRVEAEDDPE